MSRLKMLCLAMCCGGLAVATSGCMLGQSNSVAGNEPFYRGWFQRKPHLEDPPPVQVPDKLRDERGLTLKYARWMISCGTGPSMQEATRKYQELLEKDPRDSEALIGLAQIDEINGLPERAEAGYRKAAEFSPENAACQVALGRFLAGHKRWPEAIDSFQKAVLADPADRQTRTDLAVALVHHGDVEGAIPHFIRTVGDAEAHYNAAVVLNADGRQSEAEQQLRIALAKKPQLMQAKQLLTEISRPRRSYDPGGVMPAVGVNDQAPVVTPAAATTSTDDPARYRRASNGGHSFPG